MFAIQCLLIVIGLIIAGGSLTVYSLLYDIRQNQIQSRLLLGHIQMSLTGEYSDGVLHNIAYDINRIAEFTRDARRGYIPYLRYDDWYATKEDFARWERTELMAAASS